ncbi:MAG: fibronectin type III domain-containing protein [Chitinophagaceae bacterium]|nr:fibronectin type III domain-containing protein [Chitinophagaceae bacterium]
MMKKATLLLLVSFALLFHAAHTQVNGYGFSASSGIYTPVSGGVSPVLTGNGNEPLHDEGFANNIPIGFSFKYSGVNYTTIHASTNGFASFAVMTAPCFSNNLSTGGNGRLILAPLWEDLSVSGTSNLQYITTGNPGSRVFTLQWNNVLYDFGASSASLAFQLKLYETTNVIEFVYGQLPGPVQDFSGGASIGITSEATGSGSFLSLNNTGTNPSVSSVISSNTITTKPASGQVYTFTPPACTAPGNLSATGITTTSATVSWTDGAATSFEYAVTTSATPPVSGIISSLTSAFINGLLPGTPYFLHVRKDCSGVASGWSGFAFATLCDETAAPYTMPISSSNVPALPLCVTVSDDNNDGYTWKTYSSAGPGWTDQVMAYVYNSNGTTSANDWLFTRGMSLTAGTSYRLKFMYNNDATSQYTEKLKVAYGVNPFSNDMTNVLANYSSVYNETPQTASIDFTPSASGIFYIGFQAYSDADKNVLILDDISVNITPSCDVPKNLSADVQASGTSATVKWQVPSTGTPSSGYEYSVTTNAVPPASGTSTSSLNISVNGLTAYTKYYLHVRANCTVAFSDWVTKEFSTVGNDASCRAALLTAGGVPLCGNTILATSVNDPESNCSTPNNTVWYKYTPSITGTVTLRLITPSAPADPLHGWVTWYREVSHCPNISFEGVGICREFGQSGNNDTDYLISPVLVAGETYLILIDGSSDDAGEFCISMPACSPAADITVSGITSTNATVSWVGTGSFILEYGPTGFTPGADNNAGTGGILINSAVSPFLISGLSPSSIYNAYVRQNCSSAGNGYSINSMVSSFTTLGTPPPNNECSSAIPLTVFDNSCGGSTTGTTLNATASAITPLPACGMSKAGYDDDVWYTFTPVAGQQFVNIDFGDISGDNDLVAQIYTSSDNTCTGLFSLYSCSDDEGQNSLPAFYSLPVTAGTVYFIRVFTVEQNVNSQFSICITKGLLINDNATGAINLVVGQDCTSASYTNVGATQSPGEPSGSCSSITGYATVWYKFVAPAGGAVRISTAAGNGNTLTNTRVSLFSTIDVTDYSTFTILSCDEDGGSGVYENMSVLYATGLNVNGTYYIQVDKFDAMTNDGTFCITVDSLSPAMIATDNTCNSTYQAPAGSIATYTGWVPLLDANSKLIALVRNGNGGAANAYSIMQNVHTGTIRKDQVSGEYYLNRHFKITNTATGTATVQVQLFYLDAELTALRNSDPAAAVNRMRVTRQSGADCQPDFIAANGTNTELAMMSNGTQNGVDWIQVNTTSFSNFYIHSTRSRATVKVFLQGAFNAGLRRHKDVTSVWAGILNGNALIQPYNTAAFGNYTGTESVPPGFFVSTSDTTDIIDWVLLEIKNNSGTLISKRAALLREDGQIVDIDGVSPVSLYGVAGNYRLFVRHRNHLGVRTSGSQAFTPFALGVVPPAVLAYDFTTSQSKAYQNPSITTNAAMTQVGPDFCLWAGNANGDEYIRVTSLAIPPILSDASFILGVILGGNTNTGISGYSQGDLNFDGFSRATSQAIPPVSSDISFILGSPLNGDSNATKREHK